jgi:hypothetical protein
MLKLAVSSTNLRTNGVVAGRTLWCLACSVQVPRRCEAASVGSLVVADHTVQVGGGRRFPVRPLCLLRPALRLLLLT